MKTMTKTMLSAVAAVGLFAGSAMADSVGLNIYKTNNAGASNLGGVALNVDVVDTGSAFQFTVTNNSSILSSITQLYFDNSLASVLSGSGSLSQSAGVNLKAGSTTKNAPSGADIGWTGTLAMYRADGSDDATKIANGIANGGVESASISFAKVGGAVLQDVLDLLTGSGGIAAHLVDLEGNGIKTNVGLTTRAALEGPSGDDETEGGPTAVPTPAAAFGGLALMGVLASRRRRQA